MIKQTFYFFLSLVFSCLTFTSLKSFQIVKFSSALVQVDKSEEKVLRKLEIEKSKEYIGLWKLYKVITQKEVTAVSTINSFLEIKSNNTFRENDKHGSWELSFSASDSTGTLCYFLRHYVSEYNHSVNICAISRKMEDNTNYLILFDLESRKKFYYVRQQ